MWARGGAGLSISGERWLGVIMRVMKNPRGMGRGLGSASYGMSVTYGALPACLIRCSRGCRVLPTRRNLWSRSRPLWDRSSCKEVGDDGCSQGSFGF